ncbi:MAG: ATP-dependent zinc metalloprotease FtsH [Proteobacteria bacterium]|nr:ATP-dependent zinc metalloprotease FtsH [Pseudomonadota bacterium]
MERKAQIHIVYAVGAVFAIVMLQSWFQQVQKIEVIPYSEFQLLLAEGKVAEIVVTEKHIQGTFKTPGAGKKIFTTNRIEPALAESLAKYDVKVTGGSDGGFLKDIFSWLLPMVLFLGVWMFVIRRFADRQGLGGGMMSIGKSKAKIFVESDIEIGFDDVAGVDEAKMELQEIVTFLKTPDVYGRLGARLPKGVLLVGPPGTGKTLLARAVAGEAGVPFFSISGSEFVEMFVGVGAARVRDLFEQARKAAPCIIFIDELDALGRARGAFPGMGGHDEKEHTLNQLLMELDGFDPSKAGMVLLAATNRPEILDPALLRAGRFDRQVLVDRPDKIGRAQILDVHVKKVRLANDVDSAAVAGLTPGFTGADLANLVNEAALLATRRGGDEVKMADFVEAIERIVAGLEKKNRLLNPEERAVVAHHEMGHALVSLALPGTDRVEKVSIIPRGIGSLGYTIQRPTEDRYLMTRQELENKMAVLLGGRAAEMLMFERRSTGAADDLSKATNIARAIVTRYGMDETLGEMTYEVDPAPYLDIGGAGFSERRQYSEETGREIDCAVRKLVHNAFQRATDILVVYRSDLEASAKLLLQQETLTGEQLPKIAPWTNDGQDAAA